MSEKNPPREGIIHPNNNNEMVEAIAAFLIRSGMDPVEARNSIDNDTAEVERERKQLALERGLPEQATWNEIIEYDERARMS